MDKMWNLGISFPGNLAFGGKYLWFWGEIYHLDGYFDLFLTKKYLKICKKLTFLMQTLTFIPGKFGIFSSLAHKILKFDNMPINLSSFIIHWYQFRFIYGHMHSFYIKLCLKGCSFLILIKNKTVNYTTGHCITGHIK